MKQWTAEEFEAWVKREMPEGTVIGNPEWWAKKIWHAALNSQAKSAPDGWKPSEQELLDYANKEELFLFAGDEADYLAIANGVLELVQICINRAATQQTDKVRELLESMKNEQYKTQYYDGWNDALDAALKAMKGE